nr:TatD family hydrolase [Chryseobacterium sp. T16E-39]
MEFFDFHHHKKEVFFGIYNVNIEDTSPHVTYSAGIHPKDILPNSIEEQFKWLDSVIDENCFSIGECGLDSLVPIEMKIQEEVFVRQIKLSNDLKKPLVIHCVRNSRK